MQVQEIMTHPVHTVRAYDTASQIMERMAEHNVGCLPVCEDGRLIGIITDRDVVLRCLAEGLDPHRTPAHRIMSPNPVSVAPNDEVDEAARLFSNLRIRRLPVVEEQHPVGMLSIDDVARFWDNDEVILRMVRRVVPRRRERGGHAVEAQRG